MAKTVIEDLLGMLSPEEAAAVRAKIEANPGLAVRDRKQSELFGIYTGEDETTTTSVTTTPAATTHTPTVPSAAATTSGPAATMTTTSTDASAQILAELTGLKSTLDTRFAELDKKFVPAADLDKHRGNLLQDAIRTSHDMAQIERRHEKEFSEDLDLDAFNKFIDDSKVGGKVIYPSMMKAHDAYVAERRVKAEIAKGIADGVKQQTSAATIPGQTQSTGGMSPAQQVMAKARANGATEGKTSAMAAAERLTAIMRARDEGSSASA